MVSQKPQLTEGNKFDFAVQLEKKPGKEKIQTSLGMNIFLKNS